jgi:hypothetical protein
MKNTYEKMAVIFLDILGTKEMSSFTQKYSIHQLFHGEVKLNEARQAQLSHVVYERKLYSFSDCAYIIYYFKNGVEDSRKDWINLLYSCLYNTSISILKLLNSGFLVRGGASYGDCFFDDLGFFGPAIENVYLLESKHAVYPRIILGDEIGKQVFDWERQRPIDSVVFSLWTDLPRLILRDNDGYYYLNVFYELEKSGTLIFGEHNFTLENIKATVQTKISQDEIKFADCEKIQKKLIWMKGAVEKAEVKLRTDELLGAAAIVIG